MTYYTRANDIPVCPAAVVGRHPRVSVLTSGGLLTQAEPCRSYQGAGKTQEGMWSRKQEAKIWPGTLPRVDSRGRSYKTGADQLGADLGSPRRTVGLLASEAGDVTWNHSRDHTEGQLTPSSSPSASRWRRTADSANIPVALPPACVVVKVTVRPLYCVQRKTLFKAYRVLRVWMGLFTSFLF